MFIFAIVAGVFMLVGATYGVLAEIHFFKGLTKARRKELGIPTIVQIVFANPFMIFIFLMGWLVAGCLFVFGSLLGNFPWNKSNIKHQGKAFIVANSYNLTMEDVKRLCVFYNMTAQETTDVCDSVASKKRLLNNKK